MKKDQEIKSAAGSRKLFSYLAGSDTPENQRLILRHGGRYMGIGIDCVIEVVRVVKINPVPESSEEIAGVINYRGAIIPVIDLRRLLGQEERDISLDMGILIIDTADRLFGLLVEEVLDVAATDVQPRPDDLKEDVAWPLISGVGYLDDIDKIILILNPERLRREPGLDMEKHGEG